MNTEEKLELRHLAPYLPYKLKMMHYNKEKVLNAGQGSSCNWVGITHAIHHQDKTKPLLHPLSRLTEEIEHNGKKAVLYENPVLVEAMIANENLEHLCEAEFDLTQNRAIPYMVIEILYEHHFDVRQLIKKGLALPIDPK